MRKIITLVFMNMQNSFMMPRQFRFRMICNLQGEIMLIVILPIHFKFSIRMQLNISFTRMSLYRQTFCL